MRRFTIVVAIAVLAGSALLSAALPSTPAPPPDETALASGAEGADPDRLAPGLLAAFSSPDAPRPSAVRVDPGPGGRWDRGAPDPRVPADRFDARWTGGLLIHSEGPHRFSARTDGEVRVVVAGRVVLEQEGGTARAKAVPLTSGLHPIEVAYRHRGQHSARLAIDWEGPGFSREPLPARLLYHDPIPPDAPTRPDQFEEGRRQADRLGCANCHAVLDLPSHPDLGPPLADAGREINGDYLASWLADPTTVRPTTRMPAFGHGLSRSEAADLAAFLRLGEDQTEPSAELRMALNVSDPSRGRLLFRSVGCLGCHTRGDAPRVPDDRAAPDLADLGRKRTAPWIAGFLARPRPDQVGRHRPDLKLDSDASADLASYLVSDPPPVPVLGEIPEGDPGRGQAIAVRLRCAACHAIPGQETPPADLPLGPGSDPRSGCLADAPIGRDVPRFDLSETHREALRAFVGALPADPSPTPASILADDAMRRRNCFGCHARDGRDALWLGPQVAAMLAEDTELGALKGTLAAPDLSSVGDKLRPEYLAEAVRGEAPTARPWLAVRMPVHAFAPGEADAIVADLLDRDRLTAVPDREEAPAPVDAETVASASRLLGREGFGCASCHVIAGRVPPGGEPETLGPDLALARRRMSGRYFRRWVADPQRIIPGTPMPQFLVPVPSHPGTLNDQLSALWSVLASDRVSEAAALGTRESLSRQGDRALVVQDMVVWPEVAGGFVPRGVAIGLKNGQSLLFDADRLAWLSWWRGGFLYRTKTGRLWEWHPEGEPLWIAPDRAPPVILIGPDGDELAPTEVRERFGSFAELRFGAEDLTFSYRLHGPGNALIIVRERIAPEDAGWRRKVTVSGVPEGSRPALREHLPGASREGDGVRWSAGDAVVTLSAPGVTPGREPGVWLVPLSPSDRPGSYSATISLTTRPVPPQP